MEIEKLLVEAVTKPSDEVLAAAPFLNLWWIRRAGAFYRACGMLSGHPSIEDPYVTTSPIMGLNADEGWMRTRSRFYRLGKPFEFEAMSVVEAEPIDLVQKNLAEMRSQLWSEIKSSKGSLH